MTKRKRQKTNNDPQSTGQKTSSHSVQSPILATVIINVNNMDLI